MKNRTQQMQMAMEILQGYDLIQRLSKNHYWMRSIEFEKIGYNVRKTENADNWMCECLDFHHRLTSVDDKHCIHITCCKIVHDESPQPKKNMIEKPKMCPQCRYTTISKNGIHINKINNVKKQKYKCPRCKYQFREKQNNLVMLHCDPQIISEVLNLVTMGGSYRKIANHISMSHGISITHVTVLNWVKKFTKIIKDYVDSFYPELGNVWSLDEMVLNVKDTIPIKRKGFSVWLWNIIDPDTRFLIATKISKKRSKADATNIIDEGRKRTKKDPDYILTDSLSSYIEPIAKEFKNRVAHVKTKSIKEGFVNRPVERYNGEVRENTKTRRGLGNEKSAQTIADLLQINHNFVKPHMGLDGKTPAEAGGINLNLGENKFLDLIKQSTTATTANTPKKEYDIVTQLGKNRMKLVEIIKEKDCTRVIQRAWLKKPKWREINDILHLYGFVWFENGYDSCWIKELKPAE